MTEPTLLTFDVRLPGTKWTQTAVDGMPGQKMPLTRPLEDGSKEDLGRCLVKRAELADDGWALRLTVELNPKPEEEDAPRTTDARS